MGSVVPGRISVQYFGGYSKDRQRVESGLRHVASPFHGTKNGIQEGVRPDAFQRLATQWQARFPPSNVGQDNPIPEFQILGPLFGRKLA